ncbi:MAG: 3-hydroxyacyl-CoA dehydrogenase family protein [Burkholderiaceae bacterium]
MIEVAANAPEQALVIRFEPIQSPAAWRAPAEAAPDLRFAQSLRAARALSQWRSERIGGPVVAWIENPLGPAQWALALAADLRAAEPRIDPGAPLAGPATGLLPACGALSLLAHGASCAIDLAPPPGADWHAVLKDWRRPPGSQPRDARHALRAGAAFGLGPANPLAGTLENLLLMLSTLPLERALEREARFLAAMTDDPRLALAARARRDPARYPGALTERLMHTYMIEGLALLGDGIAADEIEQAAAETGFAHGPLWWMDQINLETLDEMLHDELHRLASAASAGDVHEHDHAHDHGHGHDHGHDHGHGHGHGHGHDHGHAHHHHDVSSIRMPEPAVYVLEKMAHGFGRRGRLAGGGFYEVEAGFDDELWDGLSAFARGRRKVPRADVGERLLLAVVADALREGSLGGDARYPSSAVLPPAPDFPAWTGGPLRWAQSVGRRALADRLADLATRYGPRFSMPNT